MSRRIFESRALRLALRRCSGRGRVFGSSRPNRESGSRDNVYTLEYVPDLHGCLVTQELFGGVLPLSEDGGMIITYLKKVMSGS